MLNSLRQPLSTVLLRLQIKGPYCQEIPCVFYATRTFTTTFTRTCHLSLAQVRSIQSMPSSHFLKINFNISPHLRLGLPSGLFPSGVPTKTLYTPFLSSTSATCSAHLMLLDLITQIIFGEEHRS